MKASVAQRLINPCIGKGEIRLYQNTGVDNGLTVPLLLPHRPHFEVRIYGLNSDVVCLSTYLGNAASRMRNLAAQVLAQPALLAPHPLQHDLYQVHTDPESTRCTESRLQDIGLGSNFQLQHIVQCAVST